MTLRCVGNGAATSSTTTARAKAMAASRAAQAHRQAGDRFCSRGLCALRPRQDPARGHRFVAPELFSPQIISERLEGMLKSYDFVSADTLAYFSKRPPLAQRDADFALDYVKRNAKTPDAQQAVLKGLEFKCEVLWAMLDALYHAYPTPLSRTSTRMGGLAASRFHIVSNILRVGVEIVAGT
jgi:hypothetical protein